MNIRFIEHRRLNELVSALVAGAGRNERQANAIKRGAQLLSEGRCERTGPETIRIKSTSGKTYITSLADCTEEGGARCQAFTVGVPCKHRAALQMLLNLTRPMTLAELIARAEKGYPGLSQYFDPATDKVVEGDGDSLALFVVGELADTFNPEAERGEQLEEAARVINRAIDDLQGALAGIEGGEGRRRCAA